MPFPGRVKSKWRMIGSMEGSGWDGRGALGEIGELLGISVTAAVPVGEYLFSPGQFEISRVSTMFNFDVWLPYNTMS